VTNLCGKLGFPKHVALKLWDVV